MAKCAHLATGCTGWAKDVEAPSPLTNPPSLRPEITVLWDPDSVSLLGSVLMKLGKKGCDLAPLGEIPQAGSNPEGPHSQWAVGPVKKVLRARPDI